jgi:hypothetical protein
MLRSQELLLVYPVPFAALDAGGMPAAAVRFDPPTGRPNVVHFIGCGRQNRLIERRKRAEGRQSVYGTSFRYELAPQPITHTDYHVQRIHHGELIAANEATARIAGVPFVSPSTAFERARYAAIRRWEQQYGTYPPVDKWPTLQLVVPDDGSCPSTPPAPGVAVPPPLPVVAAAARARGGEAAAPTLPPPLLTTAPLDAAPRPASATDAPAGGGALPAPPEPDAAARPAIAPAANPVQAPVPHEVPAASAPPAAGGEHA